MRDIGVSLGVSGMVEAEPRSEFSTGGMSGPCSQPRTSASAILSAARRVNAVGPMGGKLGALSWPSLCSGLQVFPSVKGHCDVCLPFAMRLLLRLSKPRAKGPQLHGGGDIRRAAIGTLSKHLPMVYYMCFTHVTMEGVKTGSIVSPMKLYSLI